MVELMWDSALLSLYIIVFCMSVVLTVMGIIVISAYLLMPNKTEKMMDDNRAEKATLDKDPEKRKKYLAKRMRSRLHGAFSVLVIWLGLFNAIFMWGLLFS